jgi:hypothetical protein
LPIYKTIGMLRENQDTDLENIRVNAANPANAQAYLYLTPQARQVYQVLVQQGRLYQGGGGVPMDTAFATAPNGEFLFVMDADGKIYAAPSALVKHHSCFLAGQPVAAAGQIGVNAGRLIFVHDQTGHYRTPIEYTMQFLKELKRLEVDVTGLAAPNLTGQKKSEATAMSKKYGRAWERLYPGGSRTQLY